MKIIYLESFPALDPLQSTLSSCLRGNKLLSQYAVFLPMPLANFTTPGLYIKFLVRGIGTLILADYVCWGLLVLCLSILHDQRTGPENHSLAGLFFGRGSCAARAGRWLSFGSPLWLIPIVCCCSPGAHPCVCVSMASSGIRTRQRGRYALY